MRNFLDAISASDLESFDDEDIEPQDFDDERELDEDEDDDED